MKLTPTHDSATLHSPEIPPFVLLHAFPVHSRMWRHQLSGLSCVTRVLTPDLRGFGDAAVPDDSKWTVGEFAWDLLRLLDSEGIDKAILGGCSMGCYTILEFWRRYPARVAGMILCGTRAEADSETLFRNRMSQIERIRAEGTGFLREFAEMNLLSPATRENQPALVEEVGRWVSQAPAESVIRVLEALAVRSDSGPSLPTIFVPVLAVFGEDDTVTPVECGERLAREIPDARLAKIRAAGHLAPLEQPEVVNEEIRTFLRRFE